jgi:hypothetical protein
VGLIEKERECCIKSNERIKNYMYERQREIQSGMKRDGVGKSERERESGGERRGC